MSFFKTTGSLTGVKDILQMNREAGRALVQFHSAVLRQESQLTVQERELIAAYVSGLNACQYCHGIKGDLGLYLERGNALQEHGYDPLLETLEQGGGI